MKITYDKSVNAAYIYLDDGAESTPVGGRAGGKGRTVEVEGETILLDFDREGKLRGIEVLNANQILRRELLAQAVELE